MSTAEMVRQLTAEGLKPLEQHAPKVGVCVGTLRFWANNGVRGSGGVLRKLRVVRVGRLYRTSDAEVERFLVALTGEASGETIAADTETPAERSRRGTAAKEAAAAALA